MVSVDPVSGEARDRAGEMVQRRLVGEPLQYVLGSWGFRLLDLDVDRRVLIPRPETEHVVQVGLDRLAGIEAPLVVDLGTGSGAIALSFALELPGARVIATDASADALTVARPNAAKLAPEVHERIEFRHGSWFEALPDDVKGTVDLVVSNPPYIGTGERLDAEVTAWEPSSALFAGADGLDDLRSLIPSAANWLNSRGAVLVEIGETQSEAVQQLAQQAGYREVVAGDDLVGRPRWVMAGQMGL
jgi:release factor glutamine methyltransferase